MLMHAIAHSVRTMYLYVRYEHRRESALKADSGTGGIEPASVLRVALWYDTLPTELSSYSYSYHHYYRQRH